MSKQSDPADFEAFLKLLPASHEECALRHASGLAAVAEGKFPQIADLTAPFVYARIMGTVEEEPLGYSEAALDLWARCAGQQAEGLETVGPCEACLYVIDGHKERNFLTAMALIDRVK